MSEHNAPLFILEPIDGSHPKRKRLGLGATAKHCLTPFDLVVTGEIVRYELAEDVERRQSAVPKASRRRQLSAYRQEIPLVRSSDSAGTTPHVSYVDSTGCRRIVRSFEASTFRASLR